MKPIIIATLLSLGLIGCAQRLTTDEPVTRDSIDRILNQPPKKRQASTPFEKESSREFAIEKAADVVVNFSTRGTMEILPPGIPGGIQPNPNGDLPPDQLISHFENQTRKQLVVVIIDKHIWSDERLKSEIAGLNRYFFARGYQRVVIQQALGNGRPIHSDLQRPSKS